LSVPHRFGAHNWRKSKGRASFGARFTSILNWRKLVTWPMARLSGWLILWRWLCPII